MCLKEQAAWPMPSETERIGRARLGKESSYRLLGDKLFAKMSEQEFAGLYPSEGQPGLSPVLLALVTVFQFIEKLPDRQAPRHCEGVWIGNRLCIGRWSCRFSL